MKRELANRLSSMTPEEIRTLLKKNPKKSSDNAYENLKMKRNDREEYPLSSTQERTWFLCQLNPDSPINNNAFAIKIKTISPSKPELFEQALKILADRHEILRTSFHSNDGIPYQKIHKRVDFKVEYLDLRSLSGQIKIQKITEEAVCQGHKIIDLASCPLLNFKILQIQTNEYVYLITPHHIISDGWSNAIFSRELLLIYTSLESNKTLNLPTQDYQYIDYVNWEKKWLKSGKYQEYLNYWKKQLENTETLNLPKDFQSPKIMSNNGAIESIVLNDNLVKQIKDFSKQRSINLFSTFLSIFNILLYKYSGQTNLTIGIPMANHNKKEFQNVMGMFLNTLPIKIEINEDLTFIEYLEQVKNISQGAFLHQELPFDKLIAELNPKRDLNKHPLFQVMFVFQNIPSLYKLNGIDMIPLKIDYKMSKFDIDFWVEEADNKMMLTLKYLTDIFKKSTMKRFFNHLQILMEEVVSNPNKRIYDLNYISSSEKEFLLSNKAKQYFKKSDKTFIHYFEKQSIANPKNIALQYIDNNLSYQELNSLSNSFAHYLIKKGVKKGDIIGLLTNRSDKSIVAMLGIMKIGAIYLPIDSSTPRERLKYIIDDSKINHIVSQSNYSSILSEFQLQTIYIDQNWQEITIENNENLNIDIQQSDLAYVIYTSGTSGMPKGVCIEHKQLLNYTFAIWQKMKLTNKSSFATVSSLAADLGNTMIFPALSNGSSVNIIDDDYLTNAELFSSYMKENNIDCIKLTPSHLSSLLDSQNNSSILPHRLLILGGETSTWELIDRIRKIKPNLRILNHYGPTETTTGVLTFEIPITDYKKKEQFSVPIGYPLDNSQIYILDNHKNIVPFGVKGEIYIAGSNLARGYLNNSELTDNYFIKNPFNENERLYKSGDYAKYIEDNNILFLGRNDKQVKIRGYRVELEGIEQIISIHQDIIQTILLKTCNDDKSEQLTAFTKLKDKSKLTHSELRKYLKDLLPSYMMPDNFVFLPEIPLTKNGKIDYNKLELIPENKSAEKNNFQAPRDNIELGISNIWKKVLNLDVIDIEDNFFEIGGQSLIAVKLFSEINKKYGINLALATLFNNGTIKALSEIIRSKKQYDNNTALVSIQEGEENTPIFLVHPAGGNILSYYELSQNIGKSYPVLGLQSTNALKWNSADFSINKMANYYLDEIQSSGFKPPYIFGGWSMGALVAFEMAMLCQKQNVTLPMVIIIDQIAPETNSYTKYKQIDEATRLSIFADKVGHLIGHDLNLTKEKLTNMSIKEKSELFLDKFKKYNLVPSDIQLIDFSDFLKLMIRHNEVTLKYNPDIYDGKVLVCRAENSFEFDSSLLTVSGSNQKREKDLGWQKYISGSVDVVNVPGDHISIMTNPNIKLLSDKIKVWINNK